jgi:hypothetical protein
MRTLAVLAFIAGVAAIAIVLGGMSTVARGPVLEVELLALIRAQGVVGVACDPEIPIGRDGAAFRCTAMLRGGLSQELDCELDREGQLQVKPASGVMRGAIPPPGDPWGN